MNVLHMHITPCEQQQLRSKLHTLGGLKKLKTKRILSLKSKRKHLFYPRVMKAAVADLNPSQGLTEWAPVVGQNQFCMADI